MVVRALAVIALVSAASCSVLFDPDKVKPTTCPALPGIGGLEAIAGEGTSLSWEWPAPPADAGAFKEWELCWGSVEGAPTSCRKIPFARCDGGCSHRVDGVDAGFSYNKRVYAELVERDLCGNEGAVSKASATPINGSFTDLQGITLSTTCDAGLHIDGSGTLLFDQQVTFGSCVSTAVMGDDQWRDSTIDLDVKVTGEIFAGVGTRVSTSATGPRVAMIMTPSLLSQTSTVLTRRTTGNFDVPVATSSQPVPDGVWQAMRLTSRRETVSLSYGARGNLKELLRWTDPDPVPGQLGLAFAAFSLGTVGGRLEVKNLRVLTSAKLPPDDSTKTQSWNFNGATALSGLRVVGGNKVMTGPCPTGYLAPVGCASCGPNASSQCLELKVNGGDAMVTFDVPVGIDETQPWRAKFKFAAHLTENALAPVLLRTGIAPPNATATSAFGGFSLLDATGNNWSAPIRAFENTTDAVGTIVPGTWTAFEMLFDPAQGRFTVMRNGMQAANGSYPAGLGSHLGALTLGGGGAFHNMRGYFTDVEVSQP